MTRSERPSRVELERLYIEERKSGPKLGEMFDVHSNTIYNWLSEYGIPRRNLSEANKGKAGWNKGNSLSEETREKISKARLPEGARRPSKEELRNLYETKRVSEVAKILGISTTTLYNWLLKDGIPVRHCSLDYKPSEETRRKMSEAHKGKPKSKEHMRKLVEGSIASITPEQRREIGRKGGIAALESLVENNFYNVEGRFYAQSLQEGAIALLLEKYVPNFRVQNGENFQVKGKGLNCGGIDFLVDGEFLEWHPVMIFYKSKNKGGDIPTAEEENAYKKCLETLAEEEREQFEDEYRKALAGGYWHNRQTLVNKSGYSGANVALATDVVGLYKFMSRHSDALPSFKDFCKEFRKKCEDVRQYKAEKGEVEGALDERTNYSPDEADLAELSRGAVKQKLQNLLREYKPEQRREVA